MSFLKTRMSSFTNSEILRKRSSAKTNKAFWISIKYSRCQKQNHLWQLVGSKLTKKQMVNSLRLSSHSRKVWPKSLLRRCKKKKKKFPVSKPSLKKRSNQTQINHQYYKLLRSWARTSFKSRLITMKHSLFSSRNNGKMKTFNRTSAHTSTKKIQLVI